MFPLLALAFAPLAVLAGERPPDLKAYELDRAGSSAEARVERSDGTFTVTGLGRESYMGSDLGSTFVALPTDALAWTFTARVKAAPTGTPNAKYGIAVRTGLKDWNRMFAIRYDGYEGNSAIQWFHRHSIGHSTHAGTRRAFIDGVEKDKAAEQGFWLRIERRYPTLHAFYSLDGEDWQPIAGDHSLALLEHDLHVGLMVTAGGSGKQPVKAVFDHVSFEVDESFETPLTPDHYRAVTPSGAEWEMHITQADGRDGQPDTLGVFVLKPKDLAWDDIRAFVHTAGSKELVVRGEDGQLTNLAFKSGPGQKRAPEAMDGWEGVWPMPEVSPMHYIWRHHDVAFLGGALRAQDIETAVDQLAEQVGFPIQHIPWVTAGMSAAGGNAAQTARLHPEKTIAASPSHIGMAGANSPDPAVLKTPHLYVVGSHDTNHLKDWLAGDKAVRQRGALWGVVPLWWYYHVIGHTQSAVYPYFLRAIDLRVPEDPDYRQGPVELKALKEEDGWLADMTTIESNFPRAVAWADADASLRRGDATWFPDALTARIWQSASSNWPRTVIHFPRFDATGGWFAPPPAGAVQHFMEADQPFPILATGPVGEGVEVQWYAGLRPLTVTGTHRDNPYLVEVEGLPAGLHILYAVTTLPDGAREISRPQMIFFHKPG